MMEEKEIVIDTKEIEQYLYTHLAKYGFVPSQDEVETITDILFDYLVDKGICEETGDGE